MSLAESVVTAAVLRQTSPVHTYDCIAVRPYNKTRIESKHDPMYE